MEQLAIQVDISTSMVKKQTEIVNSIPGGGGAPGGGLQGNGSPGGPAPDGRP